MDNPADILFVLVALLVVAKLLVNVHKHSHHRNPLRSHAH